MTEGPEQSIVPFLFGYHGRLAELGLVVCGKYDEAQRLPGFVFDQMPEYYHP